MPLRVDVIPDVKLERMTTDLARLRHNPADGPMLSRFAYDHSNTLVIDSTGKRDLLIPNSVPLASDIARLLQHISPAIVGELVNGYRLARAAGLLNDGKCNREVAIRLSRLPDAHSADEHADDGKRQMEALVEVLRSENRKPGGIKNA